jgi:hypothetical protein
MEESRMIRNGRQGPAIRPARAIDDPMREHPMIAETSSHREELRELGQVALSAA